MRSNVVAYALARTFLFSHTIMNKKLSYFLYTCLAVLTLSACSNDDDDTTPYANINRNVVTSNVPKNITRLEFPHLKGGNNIVLVHKTSDGKINYSVEWDYAKKSNRWTCYPMTNHSSKGGAGRYDHFEEDPDLPQAMRFSSSNSMYTGSGFDRGHLCASYDRQYSTEANKQTFYYSNIQPQYHAFNAGSNYDGLWIQMEQFLQKRASALKDGDTIYVCKGGTIDSEDMILTRIKNQLIVPKYFFMALLAKNNSGYMAMAFWTEHLSYPVPNANLVDYAITIDALEEKTGIDFFCNLPDNIEDQVEKTLTPISWAL